MVTHLNGRAVQTNRLGIQRRASGVRHAVSVVVLLALCATSARCGFAQTSYNRHICLDNAARTPSYSYSFGKAVPPSMLEIADQKLPVDSGVFFTPPNSLRISWKSNLGGSWAAQIKVMTFRNREILFEGNALSFWLYSGEGIEASALPGLRLHDTNRGFSEAIRIGKFSGDIPARKWTRVRIPFASIKTGSVNSFEADRLASIIFEQGTADATAHTLFIEEVRIENLAASAADNPVLPAPKNLQTRGYERHVDLSWDLSWDLSREEPQFR